VEAARGGGEGILPKLCLMSSPTSFTKNSNSLYVGDARKEAWSFGEMIARLGAEDDAGIKRVCVLLRVGEIRVLLAVMVFVGCVLFLHHFIIWKIL
jgi:hypothetical protein